MNLKGSTYTSMLNDFLYKPKLRKAYTYMLTLRCTISRHKVNTQWVYAMKLERNVRTLKQGIYDATLD